MDLKQLVFYSLLFVIVAGFLGNIIAFIVCSRSKLKKTPFSTYFRFVILIDTCVLIFNGLIGNLQFYFSFSIDTISADLCRAMNLVYYLPATSGWIAVAISIDRWASIRWATRYLFRKKSWFHLTICFGLLIKDILLYGQLYTKFLKTVPLYSNNASTNQTIGTNKQCVLNSLDSKVFSWINLLNSTVVPFVLMLVCTLLILNHLIQSKRNVAANPNQNQSQRKTKFAINAIIINLVFFVTNIPLATCLLYYKYFEYGLFPHLDFFIRKIFLVLYYVYFGSSFYVNVLVNSIFREEFFSIVFCRPSRNL
jgi:hypothetical protein